MNVGNQEHKVVNSMARYPSSHSNSARGSYLFDCCALNISDRCSEVHIATIIIVMKRRETQLRGVIIHFPTNPY